MSAGENSTLAPTVVGVTTPAVGEPAVAAQGEARPQAATPPVAFQALRDRIGQEMNPGLAQPGSRNEPASLPDRAPDVPGPANQGLPAVAAVAPGRENADTDPDPDPEGDTGFAMADTVSATSVAAKGGAKPSGPIAGGKEPTGNEVQLPMYGVCGAPVMWMTIRSIASPCRPSV